MDKKTIQEVAQDCCSKLKKVDFTALGLSDYQYNYIDCLMPELAYYYKIYAELTERIIANSNPNNYVVDFGGGHGFLSIFLKQLGFKVIYCDIIPAWIKTVQLIKTEIGLGPDIIIEGSIEELNLYCQQNQIKVDSLIASDLIEHIYDLDSFFREARLINPQIEMAFSTGSNPYNYYNLFKLYKMMKYEEENFNSQKRAIFINENYAILPLQIRKKLTKLTRGYIYKDIIAAIDNYNTTKKFPKEIEAFNTCDPGTGSWDERVLSFKRYQESANNNQFNVEFFKGFYNTNRKSIITKQIAVTLNFLIHLLGKTGVVFSPYIILIVSPSEKIVIM